MIKERDLIGLPVMNKEGEKVAHISEVFYSRNSFRILNLIVSNGRLITKNQTVKFNDIISLEKDALYINDEVINNKSKIMPKVNLKGNSFLGKEILTEDRRSLGYIRDILIDRINGKVVGFVLTEGIIDDINKGRDVLPLDNDMIFQDDYIFVNNSIEDEFTKFKEDYKKLLELL